jgi:hypothetical protein
MSTTTQTRNGTDPKPKTAEDRTREQIVAAQAERDRAVKGEYDGLIDIAWAHYRAASEAMLAAHRPHGIDDDTRRQLVRQSIESLDAARSWLHQAIDCIPEPPF